MHVCVGMEVALVVNNLGGTSNLELSLVANAAIRYLGKTGLQLQYDTVCLHNILGSVVVLCSFVNRYYQH